MLLASESAKVREALLTAARAARHHAYAPYSGYKVGAAVWCEDGRVFSGANVENASYGLSICAERVAIAHAVGEGVRRIEAMLVVTRDGGAPCGACRQVLTEFAEADTWVWCFSEDGQEVREYRLSQLLPDAFSLPARPLQDEEITLGGI